MVHPSTAPLSNVKLKRVSKVYHVLYNDSVGENTMSKCQRTEEFMRNLRALLYYVYTTTYNWINCNCLRVFIMHFYRLIWVHTQRRFCPSLSVKLSDSGHSTTYTRQFCRNDTGHKIYRFMSVRSTRHHMLLHNLTILHKKTFLRQPVTRSIYTSVCQHAPQDIIHSYIILVFYVRSHFCVSLSPAQENIVHFKIYFKHTFESKHFPF